ncbi:MAG: GNAT family N-acetyltransferase [Actinomycetota bacterium]
MDVVPAPDLDDSLFAQAHQLVARAEHALDPVPPPITAEEFRRFVDDDRMEANHHERHAVVDGDRVRALMHLEFELDDENAHFASTEIYGAADNPEAGRVALRAASEIATADGRDTLLGWGHDNPAERAFWESLGMARAYTERISALDTTAVDAELIDQWIARSRERAADMTLHRWVSACPDQLLDTFAASRTLMNGAPMEDIDINDGEVDADDIREDEDALRSLGMRPMTVMAVAPDGRPAGHTQIHVNTFRPGASYQWDTAVDPAFRERGIGRWLKAELWKWAREVEPDVTRLTTGNAEVNDAMLSINVAMGFEAVFSFGAWQAKIPAIVDALDTAG